MTIAFCICVIILLLNIVGASNFTILALFPAGLIIAGLAVAIVRSWSFGEALDWIIEIIMF